MAGGLQATKAADLLGIFAHAASVYEGCSILLDRSVADFAFERVIVFAGYGDHLDGVAYGLPDEDLRAFLDAVRDESGVGLVLRRLQGPVPAPTSVADLVPSFESPLVLTVDSPSPDFVGGVVVDADRLDLGLASLTEAVTVAAPMLARCAELDAARARVADLESERLRSRAVLDSLPDPVLVTDEENRILLANERAEDLLVTSEGDSTGRRHAVETNNLFFSAFRAKALLGADAATSRELLMVDPADGSDLLFEVFSLPFSGPTARSENLIYVLRDITDLKRVTVELEAQYSRSLAAEHAARRESERMNVIIENAGVPILVTDHETDIVMMNREAERLFESPPMAPSASPRARDVTANDMRITGLISDFLLQPARRRETSLMLVDPEKAREFPASVVSTKILNRRGEPIAIVSVLDDLTQEVENERLARELKQLNEQLEQRIEGATAELAERNRQLEIQSAELQRASRLKSEFLATMSHELRTPINSVLGYNSLLREGLFGELSEKQREALEKMRAAAHHLLTLINDILDLSKVEAGKVDLEISDVELETFVAGISETVRPMAERKGLEYRAEREAQADTVRTDPTRLRQVLLNLLSNAVKFTDEGSIVLRVRDSGDGRVVHMEVEDTGIGIAESYLEAIFEEFRQADQSVTRAHGGTGLGLTISRKLTELMGGRLAVESVLGEGSTFRVTLPVDAEEGGTVDAVAPRRKGPAEG